MIEAMFSRNGRTLLGTKVLTGIHKETWRERNQPDSCFNRQKTARARLWFDAVKDLPGRTKGLTKQRRMGKATEWEAPLVAGLGSDWRRKRDSCHTYAAWRKTCEGPIQQLYWPIRAFRHGPPPHTRK